MSDLMRLDAAELASLIARREASSVEAVDAAIERIERLDGPINAVTTRLFDEARAEARACDADLAAGRVRGVLHGVPVLIKDLFDMKAGVPNTFGCRALAGFVPNETGAHIERLESAGAVVVGKTNTPEFGHKGITDNGLFGPTSTPFDLARNAGGSSGGSAAAVAAGFVQLAQGSDAGGSVRIPAAWCGVVGFKPSYGRIPLTARPNAFDSHTPFVHIGTLTRSVRDAAIMAQAMIGPHTRDPFSLPDDGLNLAAACEASIAGLRVAFSPNFGTFAVESDVADVVRAAVGAFQAAGAKVDEPAFRLPASQDELAQLWRRQVGLFYAELFAAMGGDGPPFDMLHADDIPPEVHAMAALGRAASALDVRRDQWMRTRIFYAIQKLFDDFDLLVTPTLGCSPPVNERDGRTLGPATVAGVPVERCIGWCLTHPVNFTGHPAASVPAGLTPQGLPVGLQIIGRRFADGQVLAACRAVEEQRPWLPALRQVWRNLEQAVPPC
jgi:Asp-tRNA(Asn)/Glu-tRNA(Gln) amidotransferase A subunit family amidase